MQIRSLEAFGLSPRLLEIWERTYGPDLLPAQAAAMQKTNLRRGGSLILFAPTGAGKTLVGEMAALQAVTSGRRALYLVPTKALAEEKFSVLRRNYASLGLRVVISTRDRRYDDPALLRGDFDLAVAVPEKAHYLLNISPGIARAIGCVVVDELQMIAEPERGATLEMTLAHLLQAAPEVQIVGLSAVVDNPGPLAEWLRAEWLEVRERPVELRQGVYAGGVFRYRGQNSGEMGEERWDLPETEDGWEAAAATLALEFVARGEPTLVFLRDKRSVVYMAARLADASAAPAAAVTVKRLAALPPTNMRQLLMSTAADGVGFHSADLQFEDRRIVEEGFAAGEIAVLCSTSTLAVGINLPARNVILQAEHWQRSPGEGRSVLEPLGRGEFENMGGRAGRPGRDEAFGRAILLADSEFQAEGLLARYMRPEFEPLTPALGRLAPLAQLALLCGGGEDAQGALALYRHTFTAHAQGETAAPELPPALAGALRSAVKYGLLAVTEPAERLQITPLGRLAAMSGAGLEGFYWLMSHLAGHEPPGRLALLFLAATTPEAAALGFPHVGTGVGADWWEALSARTEQADVELLEVLHDAPERSAWEKGRAARLSLALLSWTTEASAEEIEEATHVPVGRLGAVAETLSWLVHLAGQIGALQGWAGIRVQSAELWSAQLAAGLPADSLDLYHALHGVGSRDRILALLGRGLRSLGQLQALPPAELRRLLPEAEWREIPALAEALGETRPRAPATSASAPQLPLEDLSAAEESEEQEGAAPPEPILSLDAGRPDQALFYGTAMPLRPTEFKLLHALAAQPGRCLSYDRLYTVLWGADEFVEPAQLHWHRSKLAERLRRALPAGIKLPLRTVPRHGFVLDLRPEEVSCQAA